MNDLVETLQLTALLNHAGINSAQNFRTIYFNIKDETLRNTQKKEINKYFSALSLPESATNYETLLLLLREKDAIFTFNWGPFLFDALVINSREDNGTFVLLAVRNL